MKEILEQPMLVGLFILSIVGVIVSLNILLFALKKNNKVNKKNIYKNVYYDYIDRYSEDISLLLDANTLYPLYISDNINKLNITKEQVLADLECFQDLTDIHTIREFRETLKGWNQEKPLIYDLSYTVDQIHYARLLIKYTDDHKYYLIQLHDMTFEKQNNIEMQKEIENVISKSQSKTAFLSEMSHELRTPLNGMNGMVKLALEDLNNQSLVKNYLGQAEELGEYLAGLINDLLDMSRLENNKVTLANEVFDIRSLVTNIESMFRKSIESRHIHFNVSIDDFKHYYLIGDELRISQVIINFLSNSQKFTPQDGVVTLTLKQMEQLDNQVSFMIKVSDTGKGMTNEFISRIFKPFEQENATIAKNYGGSGLGMAITDELVKLMGGSITVDSEVGKGSTFTVFLSLPYAADVEELDNQPKHKEVDLHDYKILYAEDNDVNAMIAQKMFSKDNIVIDRAINGQDVIDKFSASAIDEYSLILMDINMPIHDGREATQIIRMLERPDAAHVIIIAASADAFEEDKRKSLASGMNGHISKPIDEEELKNVLAHL